MTDTTQMSDTVLKLHGMQMLSRELGMVGAERFVSIMLREPFDYTKWRRTQFDDMSFEDLVKSIREKEELYVNASAESGDGEGDAASGE